MLLKLQRCEDFIKVDASCFVVVCIYLNEFFMDIAVVVLILTQISFAEIKRSK